MMKLKREIEDLKTKKACMKSLDEERKEAGVYEGRESLKTWANIAKRLTNEKTIEKLERVEEGVIMKKSEIRKEVEESNYETRRKKRMIVFNLKEKKENNDRDRVIEMICDMGVRVREEEIVDVVRMRKKDEGGSIRQIIVEFRTEYDKWTVLRNKSDLREMNDYRSVFLEQDVSREEREEASNDSGKESRMGAEREDGSKEKKRRKEKSTVKLVWKICTREKQMELEVWMKKNECDVCAINETGLNGDEYVEVSDEYKWIGTNRDWMRGKTVGVGFVIKSDIECQRISCDSEDVCFIKIGAHANR